MMNSTLTEQKKEFYVDETTSHISRYSWLWELEDFKDNAIRRVSVQGKKYDSTTLTIITQDGIVECWNLEFYPLGYKTTQYNNLCFLIWRDQYARADLKPVIKLSILDHEMKKIQTVSCKEYKNSLRNNNFVVPHEYLASPIRLAMILNPTQNILLNNKLNILIEFDVSVKNTTISRQVQSIDIPGGESKLSDGLSKYLDNDKFSDVVLEVKGVELKAHKMLLSAQSPVFATMFEQQGMTEATENRVKIDDMEPDVAKQMLEFIYTDKAPSKINDFAEQLIVAAHKYQMERLSIMCEGILIEKISRENTIETFIFADTYELKRLRKSVFEFIKKNPTLLETEEFEGFERGHSQLAFEVYREMMSVKRRRIDPEPRQEN